MAKSIGGTVGTGIKEVYVVHFYSAFALIIRRTVEADSANNAIGEVLRFTVENFDDGLTRVEVQRAGSSVSISYEVEYKDTYRVEINGVTYNTDYEEGEAEECRACNGTDPALLYLFRQPKTCFSCGAEWKPVQVKCTEEDIRRMVGL